MIEPDLSSLGNSPRDLPPGLLLASFRGRSWWLGWLFFCLGVLGASAFTDLNEARWALRESQQTQPTQGQVVSIEETSVTVNEQDTFGVRYSYSLGGKNYEGLGYGESDLPAVGDTLDLHVSTLNPSQSEASGLRRSALGAPWWVGLIPGAFSIVGVVALVVALRRASGWIRLLREGRVTRASLRLRESTSVMVNNQQVWRLLFDYEDGQGRKHQLLHRTRHPWAFAEGEQRWVLHDPQDPVHAGLALALAEGAVVDERGRWRQQSQSPVLEALLPPLLGLPITLLFGFLLLG